MMVSVLVPLLLTVLLTETFASLSSSGVEPSSPCPPRWLLFGQRCFAFYPVWSSWSTANTGGNLASLHTPEEKQFVCHLANTNTPVWLGGYQAQQNGSWFWSDDSPFRTNQKKQGKTRERWTCMEMTPKSGELHSAPCGELRFFICSTRANSSSTVFPSSRKPVEPAGIVPGVSLFDVMWGYSDLLVEEILHSSPFLRELWFGHLTELCYTSFIQQEALYLHRVSSTLEVLISRLQEADDMRSLLLDTLQHYSSRNQNLLTSPTPKWLHFSLRPFNLVVLEEPVYWIVALLARASLRDFLSKKLLLHKLRPGPGTVDATVYQTWFKDSLEEAAWTHRYRKVIEERQNQMDVFKAINIFRQHMISQKRLYKAVICDIEGDVL